MFDFLADALAFFYELPIPGVYHSYGGSIIMLTLAINLVLLPLTLKGTRSMMQMQRLQPEMKALQAKYKDDREKLNQEMMAFYKENSINPVGGCLPLLLQLPVFFILYQVLRGLTQRSDGSGSTFDPKYLEQSSALYQSLEQHTEMLWLGVIDLSQSAANVFSNDGFMTALPYFVLIGVVLLSSYIQQKQVSSRNPDSQTNAQQKMLLRIMPGFFALISYSLPAALTLYFATSNIFRMGQQELISRTMYRNKDAGSSNGKSGSKASDKDDKGDKSGDAGASKSNGSNGSGSESGLRALFKPSSSEPAEEPKPEGKGRPTPKRSEASGRSSSGSKAKPKSKSNKPKRSGSGRATPAGSLPQPRPRKKKRK